MESEIWKNHIYCGDALAVLKDLPDKSVNCCITSPPYYGLRDYEIEGQVGAEPTPDAYVKHLVEIFGEVNRILMDDGTLWLNLGDCWCGSGQGGDINSPLQRSNKGTNYMYAKSHKSLLLHIDGLKPKDLIGIPWMVAFALRDAGWYLRQDIIWAKGNPMPDGVTDRCTKSHEYIFLLSKSRRYYFDNEAIKEPAVSANPRKLKGDNSKRNKRDVWNVNTKPVKEAHFATFPEALIEPCVLAGCPEGGIVLDPFIGSGTTGVVAIKHNRHYVGIEIKQDYVNIANDRIKDESYQQMCLFS